jgi:hypothetical protein
VESHGVDYADAAAGLMGTLREWIIRLWGSIRPNRVDRELEEELRLHVELEAEHLSRNADSSGAPVGARVRTTGIAQAMESLRDQRGLPWLDDLRRDVRFTCRTLLKNPGFTFVSIFTLGLGIGANTAIFSVMNRLLWNPIGIMDVDRLVAVRMRMAKVNMRDQVISLRDFTDVRNSTEIFASAAIAQETLFSYAEADTPELFAGIRVSWQWFDVVGASPLLGRAFRPEEDQPIANHVVVLAHRTWRNVFGGDPAIVGRTIQLNLEPYRVIGVMGPEYDRGISALPGRLTPQDLFVPLGLPIETYGPQNRFNQSYLGLARLRPGITFDQAQAFMATLTGRGYQDPGGRGESIGLESVSRAVR